MPKDRDGNLLGPILNTLVGGQNSGSTKLDFGRDRVLSEENAIIYEHPQDFRVCNVSFGQHPMDNNYTQHGSSFYGDNTEFTGGDLGLVDEK